MPKIIATISFEYKGEVSKPDVYMWLNGCLDDLDYSSLTDETDVEDVEVGEVEEVEIKLKN